METRTKAESLLELWNELLHMQARSALITGTRAIFAFDTSEEAEALAAQLGFGDIRQSFTGRWCITLALAALEQHVGRSS